MKAKQTKRQIENEIVADGLEKLFEGHLLIALEKNKVVFVSINGVNYDLLNAIACACDKPDVRVLLYEAVRLDREHDEKVGRKNQ